MAVPQFDRRLNIVLALSGLVLAGIILFAVFAIPAILSTDSTTEAIDKNNGVAGCRATYRVSLVDERTAALFIAKSRLDGQTAEVASATGTALEALGRRDDEAFRAAIDSLPGLRAPLPGLLAELNTAADSLEQGIAAYHDLVNQSVEQTDLFLRGCNGDTT